MVSDHLNIPVRERSRYEFVFCGKCNRHVSDTCGKTGKKIYTCEFSLQHRFRVVVYVPGTSNKRITKVFTTRNYKEFQLQARAFIEELISNDYRLPGEEKAIENTGEKEKYAPNNTEHTKQRYLSFANAARKFLDYKQGFGVPAYKYKHISDQQVKEIARYLGHFAHALKSLKHDPETLSVSDIGEREVSAFHNYLTVPNPETGKPKYSAKTYNKAMQYIRSFYRYLNDELRYGLANPFRDVTKKSIRNKIEIIELDEFKSLLRLVSKENGEFTKFDRGKTYKLNHFKPWLKDAFKLMLYTGERRDGGVLMKWSHVHDHYVEVPNYKVNQILDREDVREVPLFPNFATLLKELGWDTKRDSDEFIIAPDHKNRETVKDYMSRAFTHYWKLTGINKQVSMIDLRKTYVTLMYAGFGEDAGLITGQSDAVIKAHYLKRRKIIELASKVNLSDLDNKWQNDRRNDGLVA